MITNLIGGIIFLLTGILVFFFPNFIAGYNTMTKEQKAKVNIKGLKRFMSIGLIAIGIVILILHFMGHNSIAIMIFVVIIGIIPLVVIAQKYDHNTK